MFFACNKYKERQTTLFDKNIDVKSTIVYLTSNVFKFLRIIKFYIYLVHALFMLSKCYIIDFSFRCRIFDINAIR